MARAQVFYLSFAVIVSGCGGAIRKGDEAFQAGKYHEALGFYQVRLSERPDDPEALYKSGHCLLVLERHDEARRDLLAASHAGAGARADIELGRLELALGNADGAATAFEAAALARPKEAERFNDLGVAYQRLGRGTEALRALQASRELAPQTAEVYLNLGVVYDRELNQAGPAFAHYSCYARLAPAEAEDRRVLWRMSALRAGGQVPPDTSEKDAKCPERAVDVPGALASEVVPVTRLKPLNDGRLAETERLFRQGRYEEAARAGAAVQITGPLAPRGYLLVGLAFLRSHDPFKAVPRLQAATQGDTTLADAWYELGWAFELTGDKDAATETWTDGQARFPGDSRFALLLRGR
jgi:Flp pilus assembly protein TadD